MEQILILALIFFCVSSVFSMLGLGGGVLYVPILLYAGFSFKEAPGISLLLIIGTSCAALLTFWKNRKVDWKLAMVLDPPTIVMAFAGGFFSSLIPENILKGVLAFTLLVAGALMLKRIRPRASGEKLKTGRWHWHRQFNGEDYSVHLPLVLTATALLGILSGMLGVTGGIIKLPIMVLLCGVPMDIAIATSTVMVAATAMAGLVGHAVHGNVDWRVGLLLGLAALAGGKVGSSVSITMDRARLKRIFGIVVWAVALQIIYSLLT